MKRSLRRVIAAALAVTGLVLAATPAVAQTGPDIGPLEVIATGLDNPRGITAPVPGQLLVAEAGRGGDALIDMPLGDSDGPICVGDSGAVAWVNSGGVVRRVAEGLPSVTNAIDGVCDGPGFGAFATGPQGVDPLSLTIGLGGISADRDAIAAVVPSASRLGASINQYGRRTEVTSLVDFEVANDPDGAGPDSNPYGVLRDGRDAALVADAGGNTVVRVDRSGAAELVATFTPRCVPWPFGPNPIPTPGNPCGDDALFPAQAVPTDVARHPDGDYLVSTLGGFPFAVGGSLVYKIDADHSGPALCSTLVPSQGCEVFADGLTSLVAIDVDDQGYVYVVQYADQGVLAAGSGAPGTDAGSVQIFDPAGQRVGSIDGLTLPGGVATDPNYVYITNLSVSAGGGEVVRARLG